MEIRRAATSILFYCAKKIEWGWKNVAIQSYGEYVENDQFTKEEINKRDVAGFFAHKVQETGENNGWYLSKPDPIKTDEEAIDCYMKGALYQWFEGGKENVKNEFLNHLMPVKFARVNNLN